MLVSSGKPQVLHGSILLMMRLLETTKSPRESSLPISLANPLAAWTEQDGNWDGSSPLKFWTMVPFISHRTSGSGPRIPAHKQRTWKGITSLPAGTEPNWLFGLTYLHVYCHNSFHNSFPVLFHVSVMLKTAYLSCLPLYNLYMQQSKR